MMRGAAVVAITSLLLGGCATGLPSLSQIAKPDVAAAIKIAQDNGDVAGIACYTEIGKRAEEKDKPGPVVQGPLSLFAKVRIANHQVSGGLGDELHRACAPLILDTEATLAKLGMSAAGGPGSWAKAFLGFFRGLSAVQ